MTCATMDVEDVHNVLSVMQKNLECPICLDIMKEPVATRCDHIFCRFCILQLLSKKKKGRAQCPMCKKDVTKRSLQDSPRFKLLVDGLLKIINAFELDSGYKFFPSQDYASTVTTNHKEAPTKDDLPVVQSTGYRNRAKRGVEDRGHRDRRLSLLDSSADTRLAGDADTWNCKQPKRQRTKQLITDFVSDSSEDDLFKKAGSLGSDVGQPSMIIGPSLSFELENKDDRLTAYDANDQVSSKLEADDAAASDLAEYGFSERDLESIRSNLLSVDGLRTLKESPSKNSAVLKGHLITDTDVCESRAEENGCMNLRELNDNIQLERQRHSDSRALKIALDCPYDRDDSTPENMPSTQGSHRDTSYTVSRERLKKSIKKVNEWLLKTDAFLNDSPKYEEMLPDIFYVDDEPASDNGSSVSDETKIMAESHLHVVLNAVEKSIVSVEDKVFGRVYKREKKPNQVGNMTCIADVHVDGFVEPLKVNEGPKPPSSKPKRSSGLQPEHFIKVDQKRQNADSISNGPVMVDDFGLDVEGNHLKAPIASFLDLDKIEEVGQDPETISDAQSSKTKKKKKSLKRKNKTQRTRMIQSLHLIKGPDVDSDQQQSPHHVSEVKIDNYPSSTEPGHDIDQKNVRRSKRLNLLKEDTISKDVRSGGQEIEDPPNIIPNLIKGAVLEDHGPEIHGESPTAVQNVTMEGNRCSQKEYGSAHVPDMYHRSSLSPVPNAGEMEDSDLDTELLLKTFKSAKRMSFKLDPVTETTAKGNCALMDISDIDTSRTNGHDYKDQIGISSNLCETNEDTHGESQCKSVEVAKPKHSPNLRFRKMSKLSSKKTVKSSPEHPDNRIVPPAKAIAPNDQPNDSKDADPLGNPNPAKSEGPPLHSETESMSLFPVVTNQNPSAAMRGDTRSGISQGENEQVRNDYCQEGSFDEEQVNQITSNSSQGSMTGKLLGRSASHNISPGKSPDVYSDTPDGLQGNIEMLQEDTSCGAVAEKSFVFGDGKKSQLVDGSVSPITQSQVVRMRKRKAQKIESSEEESSGDEELPCFKALFGNASANADQKNASASSSPRQQGGGVLAMFSSCSTSGKTQTSFNLPREALACSQESQCSVNLFSSQSNTSDQSVNGAPGRNGTRTQDRIRENSLKRTRMEEYGNEKANLENGEEEMTHLETDRENPCQEQNLGEVSGCESEASHTGDSSGLSSQCEILNTQQRDAMQNNLENLQREMAALEAVLEQHGSQSPTSGKEQASTAEHVTIGPQGVRQKQTDYDIYRSPDAIPETEVPSGQSRSSGLQNIDQLPAVEKRSRSPTPPRSLPKATSRKGTPEKIRASFNVFKELRECTLTDDGAMGQKAEDVLHAHDKDCSAPTAANVRNSKSPKRSLRSKLQAVNGPNALRGEDSRQSTELKAVVQPAQDLSKHPGNTQRSVSPTFKSPLRSKVDPSFKSPVVSIKRNYCLVTSGLSQSEGILVQKFARKTQSIFSSKMTESTTHVIMKTDEQLVCERTLKYFLGIAGRKWVVSHEWIVQSFREGRILDEYDFEVKGDVINGRNHRGPRRSRLGSDGLLLTDFEICCLGSFKDMTSDDLQWMVSLCGASVVPDPSQFVHKSETTSLLVVQPEKDRDYSAMRKKYRCLVISREWVLDSVSSYKLQAFDSYLA